MVVVPFVSANLFENKIPVKAYKAPAKNKNDVLKRKKIKKGGESRMLDAPRERVRELFTEN
jgi:hypothetical protein